MKPKTRVRVIAITALGVLGTVFITALARRETPKAATITDLNSSYKGSLPGQGGIRKQDQRTARDVEVNSMRIPSIAGLKQTWRGLILICLLSANLSGQQPERIPQLSLPRLEGQTLRSEDLKDNIVVLDFWATWCEACVSEIPEFEGQ